MMINPRIRFRSLLQKLTPFKIAAIYVFTAVLWFLFLKNVDSYFIGAFVFIGMTAAMLYTLIIRFGEERDRALVNLTEERNKFEAILAALGDGVSIQSTDYQVLYQNKVHQRLAGGNWVGEYCFKAYRKADAVCPDCPVALSFLDGQIHRADRQAKRGTDTIHVEVIASPLRDATGAIIGGIELVRDITPRKLAENRLSAHTSYLEQLLTVSREITTTTDLAALYRKTVTVAKETLRLDYSTLMMLSPDKKRLAIADTLGFPDSMVNTFMLVEGQGLSTYVVRSGCTGTVFDFNTEKRFEVPPIVLKEGITSALCVPMMIENEVFGVLIGHTREARDFSEGERALYQTIGNNAAVAIKNSLHLSALNESEERYRTLFENAHDMIQAVDPTTGKFLFVNPAWLAVLQYSREEVEKLTFFDVLHVRDRSKGMKIFREALAGRSLHAVQLTFSAKDGRPVSTEGTLSTQKHQDSVVASYGFFHDITGRKKVEEQLRHAQKMEAVGQLAGGIAHDFNNILTTITGYASLMLAKTDKGSSNRVTLEHMIGAAKRAAALTRGMLAYSRKQVIELRPVNLNVIVRNVENLLLPLLGEQVEFKTMLSEQDLTILADTGQIEQVLMNMAGNARDAISGQGRLMIETDKTELTAKFISIHGYGAIGHYARLCITDTGCGMDDETRTRIFEPFFTTKEVGKGTGLGLSMVYGIVKQHNGYINVYSEPGKGSTFRLYFPLTTESAEKQSTEEKREYPHGTETILLAEDDEASRSTISSLLCDAGYSVIEAENGEDAIEKFKKHCSRIQLLLFDVVMPRLNGKNAYDMIAFECPNVAVLFISGYTGDMIRHQGVLKPGTNFLSKPIMPSELLTKVRSVLDGKGDDLT